MKNRTFFLMAGILAMASVVADSEAGANPPREMRLMTYNVHHCAGADKRIDIPRVAEVIARERPDFVGLNEIDKGAKRSQRLDMPEELGHLTGLHATFAQSIPLQGGSYGNVVLSREKPLSVLRVPLPGREPRVLLLCEFADCWFGTSHFSLQETNRLQTVEIIRGIVSEKAAAKPVFVTGDWNCRPDSAPITALRGYMAILSNEKCRTYHGFKEHAPGSECCIDYIAVDRGASARVKVKETHVISDTLTSDHNPVVVTLELAKDDGWEAKRAALKNRPRPLILNSDGNEVVYWKTNLPVTVGNFTAQRLQTYRGSQVSTVAYCPWSSGFGLMTTTRAGEFLDMPRCIPELQPACHNAAPLLKAMGLDCLDLTADYCHTNGMEVFVSIRMNDTHDVSYFIPGTQPPRSYLFPKWKDAHPDCLFGSYSNKPPHCAWTAVDFENPTVRAYMKDFVKDFVENYDVDGIEYDFFRHGQLFKTVGWGAYATEAQLKLMTDFMLELRAITEAAGRRKGRPILVLVRTSDSLDYAKAQGIDVEAWLSRGVMDIWSVSDYFQLDYLRPNAELAHKYGVKFNSALAESRVPGAFGRLKKSNKRFAKAIMLPGRNSIASYAAEYAAAMAAGCDGISSFNLSCTGGINKRGLLDVDPRQTKDLDKVYFALVRGSGGYRPESWVKDGGRFYVRPRIDPGTIFKIPTGKPYVFGIEFGDEDWARFDMVAKAALAGGREVITELKVNGKTIAPGAFTDGVHAFPLQPGDLRKGYNEFSVTVDPKFGKELTFHDFAVYLHKQK